MSDLRTKLEVIVSPVVTIAAVREAFITALVADISEDIEEAAAKSVLKAEVKAVRLREKLSARAEGEAQKLIAEIISEARQRAANNALAALAALDPAEIYVLAGKIGAKKKEKKQKPAYEVLEPVVSAPVEPIIEVLQPQIEAAPNSDLTSELEQAPVQEPASVSQSERRGLFGFGGIR